MGPLGEWLPETIWPKLKSLERIKRFQNIGDAMQSDSDDWQVRMAQLFQTTLTYTVVMPAPSNGVSPPRACLVLTRVGRQNKTVPVFTNKVDCSEKKEKELQDNQTAQRVLIG